VTGLRRVGTFYPFHATTMADLYKIVKVVFAEFALPEGGCIKGQGAGTPKDPGPPLAVVRRSLRKGVLRKVQLTRGGRPLSITPSSKETEPTRATATPKARSVPMPAKGSNETSAAAMSTTATQRG